MIRIREVQGEDLAPAIQLLGEAFATQPNILAISGGRPVSPRKLAFAFEGRFKHLGGRHFVADLDGRVVGAMRMVKWPGCQASPGQSVRMLPSMLRSVGGIGDAARGLKLLAAWKKHDPRQQHWHLDPMGVSPEFQGTGIGKQMMVHYCGMVDKDGIAAYHETDRPENATFYEQFGFAVIAEEAIMGARNWFMWRAPR
jgi:GNAT superfamily N-acetyltransferase